MKAQPASRRFAFATLAFAAQLGGSALLALSTAFVLETAALAGSRIAEWLLTPFGLVGFVFGNIHQGNEHISHVALVLFLVPCFFIVLRAATYWAAHRHTTHPR